MPYVEINDINVYYEFHGPSEGTPLVLIEGWGQALWTWFKQLPAFSQKYRILIFDNRGVGRTSKPNNPYTVELLVDDTKSLMDELGIDKAHIYGMSMGGFIAQKFAISHPERILSLTIGMTNFGGNQAIPASGKVMSAIFAHPTETISKEEAIAIRRSVAWSSDFLANNPDLIRTMDRWIEENPQPEIARNNQANIGLTIDIESEIKNISAPTLIMHGENDLIVPPKNSLMLHERIPNSELVHFKSAPHRIEVERAEDFNRIVLDFLEAVDRKTWTPRSEIKLI